MVKKYKAYTDDHVLETRLENGKRVAEALLYLAGIAEQNESKYNLEIVKDQEPITGQPGSVVKAQFNARMLSGHDIKIQVDINYPEDVTADELEWILGRLDKERSGADG